MGSRYKIMIGLKRGTVKLVKHDPKWRPSFKREENKIRKIFGSDALEIQHVGSTSIPGILAKPIIDMVLIIRSLRKAKQHLEKLEEHGYKLKKKDTKKERLFLTKGPKEKRTHYLHIGEIGSGYGEDMILFRDYLLKHKDTAKKYSELKNDLAKKYQDRRDVYGQKKHRLIEAIIKKAKKSIRESK